MSKKPAKQARSPSLDDRRFGRHVRSCRRARGLTQEVLAERAGLSADTIRRLEHGSFSPSHDTLRKVSLGLAMRLSTLFSSFEVVDRDVPREIVDVLWSMDAHEHDMLLRIIHAFLELLRKGQSPCESG